MAEIAPFRGILYTKKAGAPDKLLAPPYDVISDEERARLAALDPHNCVRLILPEGAGDEKYANAARDLNEWMRQGILARDAEGKGTKVLIAGAGLAAHLAGALVAQTILPVIGVPLSAGTLGGLDSLLATVQMPPGLPVATVAIGGAQNAALLAAAILALSDKALAQKLKDRRKLMHDKVLAADSKVQGEKA
jgi:5-(carboxyamino)imidazole ribonucleotide mutase